MNNDIQNFVDDLKLPFDGEYDGNSYIVTVNSSDDFSKLFNSIDLNPQLHLSGQSKATKDESLFRFTDGYFEITLEANYNKDIYKMTVEVK